MVNAAAYRALTDAQNGTYVQQNSQAERDANVSQTWSVIKGAQPAKAHRWIACQTTCISLATPHADPADARRKAES
jgi:hypothetical protein